MLTLDLSKLNGFLPQDYLSSRQEGLQQAAKMLAEHNGPGGDFTGWVALPRDYDKEEFARIQAAAKRIQQQSQVLVVIGIGGSYLGARAVIELLGSPNYNLKQKDTPDILFAGNGLSTDALLETIALIGDRDFSVNVISKSGTTTEPAVAFRIFKQMLEEKYGKEGARERIYATTDAHRGALKGLADQEGYEEFVVPDDVGGRYSVLTAVGLLPIAVAGIDIEALMQGAAQAMEELAAPGLDNPAWQYAAARHALYEGGKKVELLACYEPCFRFFAEWWKQLYGESEGKEQGPLPRQRGVHRRPALHGTVHPGGRAPHAGDGGPVRPQGGVHHPQRPGECGRPQLPVRQAPVLRGGAGHAGGDPGPRGRRRAQCAHPDARPVRDGHRLSDLLL